MHPLDCCTAPFIKSRDCFVHTVNEHSPIDNNRFCTPLLPGHNLLTLGMATHNTAVTQFATAGEVRFAYRRFGPIARDASPAAVPLVFLQHLTGTMDNWDPAVVDGLAQQREVILFNNAGIANSTGETPSTVEGMAKDAFTFLRTLSLTTVDALGFSLGGMVAQQLALDHPSLIRKLLLIGTSPQGGEDTARFSPAVEHILFAKKYEPREELFLDLFFSGSSDSQSAGRSFLARLRERKENRDPAISDKVAPAQIGAIYAWGAVPTADRYSRLKEIKQPVLVVQGHTDMMIPTINSYILQQQLPNAELILYPDSNHGSLFQYPNRFVEVASSFLSRQ